VNSTGYLAAIQRSMAMGINFDLTQNTIFTLAWRNNDSCQQRRRN